MMIPLGFILTAGPGWLAVNKPAGLSVHNDPAGDAVAIATACFEHDDELTRLCGRDDCPISPAHRLDKETSGVLVFATTRESASVLQSAFAEASSSKPKKIYHAIVRGSLAQPGEWTAPLTDKAEGRDNPAGRASERKPCVTRYEIVRGNRHLTEIEVELGTGRQHQIRKHAALSGHPIVGDRRYNDLKHVKMIETRFGISRMLLHARLLELEAGRYRIEAEAPLPTDFDKVFSEIST